MLFFFVFVNFFKTWHCFFCEKTVLTSIWTNTDESLLTRWLFCRTVAPEQIQTCCFWEKLNLSYLKAPFRFVEINCLYYGTLANVYQQTRSDREKKACPCLQQNCIKYLHLSSSNRSFTSLPKISHCCYL